ncbi:nucleotidyl transferase AbiEii/AbiGii toxin family protein [Puniceicoccaceae bacterium K14]|nr:nucleotidyl transferase AbiEii/AbiGii toxin family protein [Puniceicoccaceae bacterium K14]
MDDFAKRDPTEREIYFQEAGARMGMPPHIVEKDFWVCWSLKRVFELDSLKGRLLFKGGTSLSKVYKLIERFSEDIDLSIHRSSLGFENDTDPANPTLSGKKRKKQLDELSKATRFLVNGTIKPELSAVIETQLGPNGWILEDDKTDPDGQSLAFVFPRTGLTRSAEDYFKPSIKIEFGARSDHVPAITKAVAPYMEEALPELLEASGVVVKALGATRTFWEKATILHQTAHRTEGKSFPARYSRHYCDLAGMIRGGTGDLTKDDDALLATVVEHKKAFYRSSWASYDTAVRGSLRLLPPERYLPALKADLDSMKEMFFGDPPILEDILDTIRKWQDAFNNDAQSLRSK